MLTGLQFVKNIHKSFFSPTPNNIHNLPCLLLFNDDLMIIILTE